MFWCCSLWSRLYLPYLPCFLDKCTFFWGVLYLEQALSNLSTLNSRYVHAFLCKDSYHFEAYLLSTYLPCFLDMYITFLGCSLWSRLYLPYLPCFSDMHTNFWVALFGAGSFYPIYLEFKICTCFL